MSLVTSHLPTWGRRLGLCLRTKIKITFVNKTSLNVSTLNDKVLQDIKTGRCSKPKGLFLKGILAFPHSLSTTNTIYIYIYIYIYIWLIKILTMFYFIILNITQLTSIIRHLNMTISSVENA